jgi:uncharacterized protein
MIKELESIDIVIYHAYCADGFAAAWCIWKYYTSNNLKLPIFLRESYNKHSYLVSNFKDKNVLFVDFCYSYERMTKIKDSCSFLFIIDHHITSSNALVSFPDTNKIFNTAFSAAYLTYSTFFPDKEVPTFIKYVSDRDTWKFEYPDTLAFSYGLFEQQYDFDVYDKYSSDEGVKELIVIGTDIKASIDLYIEEKIKEVVYKEELIGGKKYKIAYCTSGSSISELGNAIVTKFDHIDFCVINIPINNNNSTRFSLRSIDTKTDVSEIASLFGGGGHRNASGIFVNEKLNFLGEIKL